MYRVFDKKEQVWIKDNVYLAPNGDLFISKKSFLGNEKLSLVSSIRYVQQKNSMLVDKNNTWIHEGDICKIDSLDIIVVVVYEQSMSSFILLDYKNSEYYPLVESRCNEIEIIGDVFNDKDLIPEPKKEQDKQEEIDDLEIVYDEN